MRRACLFLLPLVLIAGGCETRSHLNPLDPENPRTGGTPGNLIAWAGDEQVELVFDRMGIEDVVGFRVWSWEEGGETLGVGEGIISADETSVIDTTVSNGLTYGYLAEMLVGVEGESHLGLPVFATPGPHRLWAIDGVLPPLGRLTADGRALVSRSGMGGAYSDLHVNQTDVTVGAADEWTNTVLH